MATKTSLKAGGYNETYNKRVWLKQYGTQLQDYFNQVEAILCRPMSDQEKVEAVNQISYIFGKMTVAFMNVATYSEMFDEFTQSGKTRERKAKSFSKNDLYEFKEEK